MLAVQSSEMFSKLKRLLLIFAGNPLLPHLQGKAGTSCWICRSFLLGVHFGCKGFARRLKNEFDCSSHVCLFELPLSIAPAES